MEPSTSTAPLWSASSGWWKTSPTGRTATSASRGTTRSASCSPTASPSRGGTASTGSCWRPWEPKSETQQASITGWEKHHPPFYRFQVTDLVGDFNPDCLFFHFWGGCFQSNAASHTGHCGSRWWVPKPRCRVGEVWESFHRDCRAHHARSGAEGVSLQGPRRAPPGQRHVSGAQERPLKGLCLLVGSHFIPSAPASFKDIIQIPQFSSIFFLMCFRHMSWMERFTIRPGFWKRFKKLPRSLKQIIQTFSGLVS